MRRLAALALVASGAMAADSPAVDPLALERMVLQDCGSCHGLTLKGGLGPDIRPQSLAHYESETLAEVILDGIPGTPMPPWRPLLTKAEVDWIVTYLLTGGRE